MDACQVSISFSHFIFFLFLPHFRSLSFFKKKRKKNFPLKFSFVYFHVFLPREIIKRCNRQAQDRRQKGNSRGSSSSSTLIYNFLITILILGVTWYSMCSRWSKTMGSHKRMQNIIVWKEKKSGGKKWDGSWICGGILLSSLDWHRFCSRAARN